jgi:queuine tRNA-ribosyltransferase
VEFKISASDSHTQARAGTISTSRGDILTPIFMPVGTVGSVKGVHGKDLASDIKAQIILGNTYHLYLRPGMEIMKQAGGLHKFINWDRPILTDSGGYQVFSLAANRKLTEEGALFRSHIDGSKHLFTPENVMDIQRIIGADIIMAFDECPPYPCDYKYAHKSMELTHRWLSRCVERFRATEPLWGHGQELFPIVQGSVYPELRRQSAEYIAGCNCFGNAIGGLSVGEPADEMYAMLEIVNSVLPVSKPRYLMGVGTPANILEAIALGTDMFDCVMPTRNGRNGMLFTWQGTINIKNKKWENDFSPIDEEGTSFVDKAHSKAYLRHLISSGEMLGSQIASIHNLAFYIDLVSQARQHIIDGDFSEWKKQAVAKVSQKI